MLMLPVEKSTNGQGTVNIVSTFSDQYMCYTENKKEGARKDVI
jgi:hypothetical protein